ncbi:autophagy-related protein 16-1-like [Rhincodon typus]|uniref:autophagy-related protein 16-1-like n=1 Tax=Rhincodon typus TaxID=259920 RepID=UPI002030B9AC|nr:autophagy-related protein 16-1-like [Rhincodon typus]
METPSEGTDWRKHIIRQLQHRDLRQKLHFEDLIHSCEPLALLAQAVFDLSKQRKHREVELEVSQNRLVELEVKLSELEGERDRLLARFEEVEEANGRLKKEYDSLQQLYRSQWEQLLKQEVEGTELIQSMIDIKAQAARDLNYRNEKPKRVKEKNLEKDLAIVSRVPISLDTEVFHPVQKLSPEAVSHQETKIFKPFQSFRSSSLSLPPHPRLFQSFKDLFRKRANTSFVGVDCNPTNFCSVARVPARVRFSLQEAHDGEVNAVKFSPNSKILATGGSDRKVKLWDIVGDTWAISRLWLASGKYNHATHAPDNDNPQQENLTIDPLHSMAFPSSEYPTITLLRVNVDQSPDQTGTAIKHSGYKGVSSIPLPSRCSDIVCSDYLIISGHFDEKVRLWDSRSGMKTDEIPLQGKVTSLDINSERTQLLSCSRDDLLKVVDLRMNETRQELRAEGFKCGADWTKAIFSPDGSYAIVGSSDGVLYVWDTLTGKLETSLVGQHRSSINAVSWSLSGEYVVSVDRSRLANLWTDC